MGKSMLFVLLFFSYSCFSQGKTFISCNSTIKIQFEKINSKDSILMILSFQNTSGKSIYLSDKIKTRWTLPNDYLDIYLGDNFDNEPTNYNYEVFHLPNGKMKKFQLIIKKSRADLFYVQIRGSFIEIENQGVKAQYLYGDFPIDDRRRIYYDFSENFYQYDN